MTSVFSVNAESGNDIESIVIKRTKEYKYYIDKGKVAICKYLGKAENVTVPSKIEGLSVQSFGFYPDDEAGFKLAGFKDNKYVKKIVFPKSIKYIALYSVSNCKNLESVKIKSKIKTVIGGLFYNCRKLKTVSLPDTVKTIDYDAFKNTDLHGKFRLGKNVKEVTGDAFEGTKIKKFSVAKGNKYFSTKKGVLYSKDKTKVVCYPCAKKTETYKTPKETEKISLLSFRGIKYLKNVFISKNTKKIEYNAFNDCKKLSKIIIDTKKSIEIEKYAVSDCPKLTSVLFKTDKEITIGKEAFDNCTSLKKVTVPPNVMVIEKRAFGYGYENGKYGKISGFTIKGYKGTAAEKYAKKNGFKFVALDK